MIPTEMASADVVVIGGGVVGLTAAYEASQLGHHVTIVDAAYQGRATDAGAGIVNPLDLNAVQSAAERHRVALFGSGYASLLTQLADDGESDHGYATVGQVVVATNETEGGVLEGLSARLSHLRPSSVADYIGAVRPITAGEAGGMVPYLAEGVRGLLLPGIARVDGRQLSACLTRALRKKGVRWRHGTGHIVAEDGTVVGVDVEGTRIDTGRVIVAAGSWSVAHLPRWLSAAVTPVRGQIVHLCRPGSDVSATPVVSAMGGPYILSFAPDRIVTGATHEDVGFDYRVTAGGVADVLTSALKLAPGLADATMVETRVGFRPVSRDRLPIVGPVAAMAGAVIATGLGAHGLTLAPAVGMIAARLALGQDARGDLAALRPDRFAAES